MLAGGLRKAPRCLHREHTRYLCQRGGIGAVGTDNYKNPQRFGRRRSVRRCSKRVCRKRSVARQKKEDQAKQTTTNANDAATNVVDWIVDKSKDVANQVGNEARKSSHTKKTRRLPKGQLQPLPPAALSAGVRDCCRDWTTTARTSTPTTMQAWMRDKQHRLLVLWGRYDLSFELSEPEA